MINFESVKLQHNDVLVLEQNIPDFPSHAIREEAFPINISIKDWKKETRTLIVERDFDLTLDDESIPIHELYGTLYNIKPGGQKIAYNFESDYFGASYHKTEDIGQETGQIEALSKQFPFSYKPKIIRIQALPHLNTLRYYGFGKAGTIVAIKDYDLHTVGLKWQHRGVFRLPIQQINSSETVLIVENPLIADFLQASDICAIPLPSEDEVSYYDYPSLLSGKELLICLRSYGQNFSFSIYPLASTLLSQQQPVSKVNLYNAFSNTSIPSWLKEHSSQQLLDMVRKNANALEASDIPTRKTYNRNRSGQGIINFNPAQAVKKGSLIYSYSGTKTVLSNPLRTVEYYDLELMEKLIPSHYTPVQSRLDQDIIEHVRRGDYLQPTSLYNFVRSFIKRFLYFEHREIFDVLTAWMIGSYVYQLFQAYPYLHFMGVRGTGKTTILEILSQLSFNGKHLTKATPSSLIHQVHYHSSTLCIDEFEDYSSKRKSEDDLSRFLNGGYHYKGSYEKRSGNSSYIRIGGSYRKLSGNNNNVLNTYSPKAFGGTGDIFIDTLKSRSIQIKTLEKPKNIQKEQFVEFDNLISDDIRLIQLSCFAFGLTNTSTLFDTIACMPTDIRLPISNIKLDNRKLQLAKPLLTVAELIEGNKAKRRILEGLDICWYEDAANQSHLLNAVRKILKSFLAENEPDNEDTVHRSFITEKLWKYPLKQKYENDFEVLRRKGKFNALLEERLGITRTNGYAITTKGNESLYLVPISLVDELIR